MGAITPNNVEFARCKRPFVGEFVDEVSLNQCVNQWAWNGGGNERLEGLEKGGNRTTEPRARPGIHFPGSTDIHMLLDAVILGLIACLMQVIITCGAGR